MDTNVVSEPGKPQSDSKVVAWFGRQPTGSLYLTAINLAELAEGVAILPEGRRKEALQLVLNDIAAEFKETLLSFDGAAALAYASVIVHAERNRYTLPIADAQIAAIAKVHGYMVATRDVEPFLAAGVPVINPWEE